MIPPHYNNSPQQQQLPPQQKQDPSMANHMVHPQRPPNGSFAYLRTNSQQQQQQQQQPPLGLSQPSLQRPPPTLPQHPTFASVVGHPMPNTNHVGNQMLVDPSVNQGPPPTVPNNGYGMMRPQPSQPPQPSQQQQQPLLLQPVSQFHAEHVGQNGHGRGLGSNPLNQGPPQQRPLNGSLDVPSVLNINQPQPQTFTIKIANVAIRTPVEQVLMQMKQMIPALSGHIVNEHKIKKLGTENSTEQVYYFYINVNDRWIAQRVAQQCSKNFIVDNQLLIVTLKEGNPSTPQESNKFNSPKNKNNIPKYVVLEISNIPEEISVTQLVNLLKEKVPSLNYSIHNEQHNTIQQSIDGTVKVDLKIKAEKVAQEVITKCHQMPVGDRKIIIVDKDCFSSSSSKKENPMNYQDTPNVTLPRTMFEYLKKFSLLQDTTHYTYTTTGDIVIITLRSNLLNSGQIRKEQDKLVEFSISSNIQASNLKTCKKALKDEEFKKKLPPHHLVVFSHPLSSPSNEIMTKIKATCKIVCRKENRQEVEKAVKEVMKGTSYTINIPTPQVQVLFVMNDKLLKSLQQHFHPVSIQYSHEKKHLELKGNDAEKVKEALNQLFYWFQDFMKDPSQIPPLPTTDDTKQTKAKAAKASSSSMEVLPHFNALYKFGKNPIHYEFLPVTIYEYNHWKETNQAQQLQAEADKYYTAIDFVNKDTVFDIVQVENCFIYVNNVNILDKNLHVEALVNCANPFQEGSPFSNEFKNSAGSYVEHEFNQKKGSTDPMVGSLIETSAGNLSNVKTIYNVIMLLTIEEQDVVQAVYNILQTAEQNQIKSLAIPPFVQEGPQLNMVITTMVKTIANYFSEHPNSSIREIHLFKKEPVEKKVLKTMTSALSSLKHSILVYNNHTPNQAHENEEMDVTEYTGTFRFYNSTLQRFVKFTEQENNQLCELYIQNPNASFNFKDGQGVEYHINFKEMTQSNIRTGVTNDIQLVPKKACEGYIDSVYFYSDDAQQSVAFKPAQNILIENGYKAKQNTISIKDATIVFNNVTNTIERVDTSNNHRTSVVRYPVLKILECQREIPSYCKKGETLYVVWSDNENLWCVRDDGSSCQIPKLNAAPFKLTTNTKKKIIGQRSKMHMIKLISPKDFTQRFTIVNYKQFIDQLKISKTVTVSKSALDSFLENNKGFKALKSDLLNIIQRQPSQMDGSVEIVGFSPIVKLFCQHLAPSNPPKNQPKKNNKKKPQPSQPQSQPLLLPQSQPSQHQQQPQIQPKRQPQRQPQMQPQSQSQPSQPQSQPLLLPLSQPSQHQQQPQIQPKRQPHMQPQPQIQPQRQQQIQPQILPQIQPQRQYPSSQMVQQVPMYPMSQNQPPQPFTSPQGYHSSNAGGNPVVGMTTLNNFSQRK
ncbi:hypothetical protein C9374_001825 [Naegleria lovaniensis]|uniref:Macro domain-containing protein n=1 Tax=Naegleria lovaniensis TaxID=51637 RepID=A0AA88GTV1_NAELO|nr:uncharacterized protein C9374_001825 [Naegleria lovaniensis]KAG2386790.1 hypothetical protein C9374_001825 [Naegleria lovaniensis]